MVQESIFLPFLAMGLLTFIVLGMIRWVVTFIRRIASGRSQFEEEEHVSHSRIES